MFPGGQTFAATAPRARQGTGAAGYRRPGRPPWRDGSAGQRCAGPAWPPRAARAACLRHRPRTAPGKPPGEPLGKRPGEPAGRAVRELPGLWPRAASCLLLCRKKTLLSRHSSKHDVGKDSPIEAPTRQTHRRSARLTAPRQVRRRAPTAGRAGVHRDPHRPEHPRAGGRAHPGGGLREPDQVPRGRTPAEHSPAKKEHLPRPSRAGDPADLPEPGQPCRPSPVLSASRAGRKGICRTPAGPAGPAPSLRSCRFGPSTTRSAVSPLSPSATGVGVAGPRTALARHTPAVRPCCHALPG